MAAGSSGDAVGCATRPRPAIARLDCGDPRSGGKAGGRSRRGVASRCWPAPTQEFLCCLWLHPPSMPAPQLRMKQVDARVAVFSTCRQPSKYFRRAGFRIVRFKTCSAFGHVPACTVVEPPGAAVLPACLSPFRCLHEPLCLLPKGATIERDSHPPGRSAVLRSTEICVPASGLSASSSYGSCARAFSAS